MTFVNARIACIAVALALGALAAEPAAAVVGAWADGAKARARLLAAGTDDGRLAAAIEVILPPGWKTYWRSPGDAGIPPVFDFSASRNLGPADIAFPVPRRYDDGYSITNVYTDRVVLPVDAAVLDNTTDVDLAVAIDLGVCDEICIPDHVEARLAVPVGEDDPVAAAILADARAALPGPPEPGVFFVDRFTRDGGTDTRPVFRFAVTAPGPATEVFVEGPADWYAGVPARGGKEGGAVVFAVKFDRLGAQTSIEDARFRVTIVHGGRAIEQTIGLDDGGQVD